MQTSLFSLFLSFISLSLSLSLFLSHFLTQFLVPSNWCFLIFYILTIINGSVKFLYFSPSTGLFLLKTLFFTNCLFSFLFSSSPFLSFFPSLRTICFYVWKLQTWKKICSKISTFFAKLTDENQLKIFLSFRFSIDQHFQILFPSKNSKSLCYKLNDWH